MKEYFTGCIWKLHKLHEVKKITFLFTAGSQRYIHIWTYNMLEVKV